MFRLIDFIIAPFRYPSHKASLSEKLRRYLFKRIKSEVATQATLDEVGLRVDLAVTLPQSSYTFYDDELGQLVDKSVYFFLAKPDSFEIKLQHKEGDESMDFLETKWVTLDEALSLIKYPQEKRIIRVAEEEVERVG